MRISDWISDVCSSDLLRQALVLFANLRPAFLYPQLANASSLKPEVVSGLDLLIVRELTGGIYFGRPRGRRKATEGAFTGEPQAFDTMHYAKPEITRISHGAFQEARKPPGRLCKIGKASRGEKVGQYV